MTTSMYISEERVEQCENHAEICYQISVAEKCRYLVTHFQKYDHEFSCNNTSFKSMEQSKPTSDVDALCRTVYRCMSCEVDGS